MNENQKQFLNDLDNLLSKYSISKVSVWRDEISFESNNCELAFSEYEDGEYRGCYVTLPDYVVNRNKTREQ